MSTGKAASDRSGKSEGKAASDRSEEPDDGQVKERPAGHATGWHRWLPEGCRSEQRQGFGPDIIAGITLAAISIPECMGYTKIVGTPVVTGLYTILLPIAAFALLGSSRHLVVGADSATAAILFAALSGPNQPYSDHWLALTSMAALITAVLLVVASLLRMGFLANFLSRTVLVGFLSGVGVSLMIRQLPDMLGISVPGRDFVSSIIGSLRGLPQAQLPTVAMAAGVLAVILLTERIAEKAPGSLIAIVLSIVVTWAFRLEARGIAVVGAVQHGLPHFGFPQVSVHDAIDLLPACASMFLVIVAQSAATARSFAQKYNENLDEDRDLMALGAANALAGISSTFVVNGSPTKTAVVDAAGGRSQISQLTTAVITLAVLLFATALIRDLPVAALGALVFVIGWRLIDVRSLREIFAFRKRTFAVALGTLMAVVFFGVERGIFLAVGLSILDHLQQEYHPKDIILTFIDGHWRAIKAGPGVETEPGLILYRFEAPLFFANVDYFATQIRKIVDGAPHPVQWLVLDLVSMSDIDYTAGLTLHVTLKRLQQEGISIALVQSDDVRDQLDRFGISERVGSDHFHETVQSCVDAFHAQAGGK